MEFKAFSPTGKTVVVAAATTAPSGVQIPESGTGGGIQFRIYNAGSVIAFLSVGVSAGAAQSAALVPSAGTGRDVVALPPGITEVLSFPMNSYFSAITASSTATVYICPGKGL